MMVIIMIMLISTIIIITAAITKQLLWIRHYIKLFAFFLFILITILSSRYVIIPVVEMKK
jgi:hypothetical protein